MVKLFKLLISFFLVGVLSACSTVPTASVPDYKIPSGSRIGVIVVGAEGFQHTHIGTTVFNNFEKNYDFNWVYPKFIQKTLEDKLNQAGFVSVSLAKDGIAINAVKNLVTNDQGVWKLKADAATQSALQRLGVKALVVANEQVTMASMECTGGPCSKRMVSQSGFFTRSFMGMNRYMPVSAYDYHVYVLEPAVDLAVVNPVRQVAQQYVSILKDFKEPKDFKNAKPEEMQPVMTWLEEYAVQMAEASVKALRGEIERQATK